MDLSTKVYGAWAGDEKGTPYNPDQCAQEVRDIHSSYQIYQCSRKKGYGPDGLYCKQHAPKETLPVTGVVYYAYVSGAVWSISRLDLNNNRIVNKEVVFGVWQGHVKGSIRNMSYVYDSLDKALGSVLERLTRHKDALIGDMLRVNTALADVHQTISETLTKTEPPQNP